MKKSDREFRAVTFLNREELDFLDGLVKDIYFDYGIRISREKIIKELIVIMKEEKTGGEIKEKLMNRRNIEEELVKLVTEREER
ncbi:MAG: hypothetical protein ABH858_05805 [Candidatus Omnitrophota bacterium]